MISNRVNIYARSSTSPPRSGQLCQRRCVCVHLGSFTIQDLDICLRSFCADSSSPQISAICVCDFTVEMTVSAILRKISTKCVEKCQNPCSRNCLRPSARGPRAHAPRPRPRPGPGPCPCPSCSCVLVRSRSPFPLLPYSTV